MKPLIRWMIIATLGLLFSLGIHTLIPVSVQPVAANQGLALMQAGNQNYNAGQFLEAAQVWRQAAQGYEQAGDRTDTRAIELLTLSACETATGDKRATLGLAGIAVRAGARSTLATLWQVKDESTAAFAIQFYKVLKDDTLTKAQALRQAQLYLMEKHPNTNYRLPYYWAPFVLVGNWL